MVPDEKLIFFNQQGLIPGPDETEEEFIQRANYCLKLKANLPDLFDNVSSQELELGDEAIHQAYALTKKIYGLAPEWIPLLFSNYKLAPWHGGCAWIFQLNNTVPFAAFFQLRQEFRHSSRYLGIYERNELIAHELVHAARMMFEEPRFEEIIAYQSTPSFFRKWFGPIIQSSRESLIFVLSLGIVFLLEIYSFFIHDTAGMKMAMAAALFPLGLTGFALIRLWMRQTQFSRCLCNLKSIVKEEDEPTSLALRLTDREIIAFSKMAPEEIQTYIKENGEKNIRLKMICRAYF